MPASRSDKKDELASAAGTKDRIIQAATKLFAAQGFEGTSTKEICIAADVNIAAIHYHFESKEGLLRHILESFGISSLSTIQRILEPPETAEEFRVRLRMYVEETLDNFLAQPELWRIVCQEAELFQERSVDVFRRTFTKKHQVLEDFLAHAKKKGIISKDVNPAFAQKFIFGQIAHQTRFDGVSQKLYGNSLHDVAYRTAWVKHTLQMFISGLGEKK